MVIELWLLEARVGAPLQM